MVNTWRVCNKCKTTHEIAAMAQYRNYYLCITCNEDKGWH